MKHMDILTIRLSEVDQDTGTLYVVVVMLFHMCSLS